MTSDIMKPLPDTVLDGLLHLPDFPKSPLIGAGFRHVKFPERRGVILQRLWCAIPSAHKHEERLVISPEAFNVVNNYLITLL